MVKSPSKKCFKKDIPILKIKGNSKYCNQHKDSNCVQYSLFGPICTNKKFYKRLIGFLVLICSSWVRESQQGI